MYSKQPIQDIFKSIHEAREKKSLSNLYDVIIPNNYGSGYHGSYSNVFNINGYSYKLRIEGHGPNNREHYNILKAGVGHLDRFSNYSKRTDYDSGYYAGFYMVGNDRNNLITIGAKSQESLLYLKSLYHMYKR